MLYDRRCAVVAVRMLRSCSTYAFIVLSRGQDDRSSRRPPSSAAATTEAAAAVFVQ